MLEKIELGSTPSDEDCIQVGESDYEIRAYAETTAYVNQLYRVYAAAHEGKRSPARISVKEFSHDFGAYFEAVVSFQDNNEEQIEAAFWLDNNAPSHWDDEAKQERRGDLRA